MFAVAIVRKSVRVYVKGLALAGAIWVSLTAAINSPSLDPMRFAAIIEIARIHFSASMIPPLLIAATFVNILTANHKTWLRFPGQSRRLMILVQSGLTIGLLLQVASVFLSVVGHESMMLVARIVAYSILFIGSIAYRRFSIRYASTISRVVASGTSPCDLNDPMLAQLDATICRLRLDCEAHASE